MRWGVGTGILAILLAFAVYIVGQVIVASIFEASARGSATTEELDIGVIAYQFLALGTAIAAGVLVIRRYGVNARALGFRFPGWTPLATAALTVIPVFLGVALLYFLFSTLFPSYHLQGNTQDLLHGKKTLTGLEKIGIFIWAAIEAPITEETLFRGMLFQGLRETVARWLPRTAAVITAAMLSGGVFGALHFEPQTFPILAFLGIVLALIFQYSRSIYASMLVHGIVNALAIITLIQSS